MSIVAAVRLLFVASVSIASYSATQTAVRELGRSNAKFAFDLYRQLASEAPDDNIFFSPFSISSAMAMTYGGSKGITKEQMSKVMHFAEDTAAFDPNFKDLLNILSSGTNRYTLSIANRLFGGKLWPISEQFQSRTARFYNAAIQTLDFSKAEIARSTINGWVMKKTMDKIQNLFPRGSIHPGTAMVLASAVYFKGKWNNPFNVNNTKPGKFYSSGKWITLDMMSHSYEIAWGYSPNLDFSILEIPYEKEELAMYILLPRELDGLAILESNLTLDKLEYAIESTLRKRGGPVQLTLPKFKLTQSISLRKALSNMGMLDLFSDRADLSGITTRRSLKVDGVVHKCFVDVNEEGTEAAGSTGISFVPLSLPPTFNVNRPFMFFIRDKSTGSILFWGRLKKAPSETEPIGAFQQKSNGVSTTKSQTQKEDKLSVKTDKNSANSMQKYGIPNILCLILFLYIR